MNPESDQTSSTRHCYLLLMTVSLLLIVFCIFLTVFSSEFTSATSLIDRPIPLLVSILSVSGLIYLLSLTILKHISPGPKVLLLGVLLIGLLFRIIVIFSNPILENDYFRYLWDGSVTANGINPYLYAPDEINGENTRSDIPEKLVQLRSEYGEDFNRINHPHIRSIYPPVAQFFFALAHFIKPWNTTSWRFILLLVDLLNVILLLFILKRLAIHPLFIILYWWNPLLVKEIFNSGHMDILIFPFLLTAIYLAIRQKYVVSLLCLALSIGIKIWPVMLLPILVRPLFRNFRNLSFVLMIFSITCFTIFLPVLYAGIGDSSGYNQYLKSWQNNDSLFKIMVWIWEILLPAFSIHPGHSQLMARLMVIAIILLTIIFLNIRVPESAAGVFRKCLLLLTILFLISPTQFPWYFIWLLPFLTIHPKFSLLLLTVLLPVYYLRYYFDARGQIAIFDNWVVWVEYIPVWVLLVKDWVDGRKHEIQNAQMLIQRK